MGGVSLHSHFLCSQAMKAVAESEKKTLTVEERNLLSVAYKNVVGSKRSDFLEPPQFCWIHTHPWINVLFSISTSSLFPYLFLCIEEVQFVFIIMHAGTSMYGL